MKARMNHASAASGSFRMARLSLACTLALGAASLQAAPRADFTVLPTLGGGFGSAYGINEAGQVVGWSFDASGNQRAFLWDAAGGIRDLGTLGGTKSWAFGLNDAGQVVGYSLDASGNERAFLWDAVGGMRDLGTLGGTKSRANGINNAGEVVGWSFDASGIFHTFLWDAASGMRDLGIIGFPYGINDAGQMVGYNQDASGNQRAVLWDAAGGIRDLGTLGGTKSWAFGLNDAGQVVGRSQDASGGLKAFLWTADGGMTNLGGLVGIPLGLASDINEYAQVVADRYLLTLHPDWEGGDGYWDDYTGTRWNWAGTGTAAAKIGEMHDVVIDPGVSATVRGSRDGRARSLRIGGTAGQLAALDLNRGTTTVLNGATLAEGGMLKGNGRLQGDLTVQAGGRVSVAEYETMQLAGNVANGGDVDVQAASGSIARLEVTGDLANQAGARLNLHNAEILAQSGLANAGRLNASGEVRISGVVNNQTGGRVQVSGTAADAIFWDDFVNDGTVIVTDNSTATFFGLVSGKGAFLGTGLKHFAGGVSPGASPGMLTMDGMVNFVFGDLTMELGGSTTPGMDYDKIVFASTSSVTIDSKVKLKVEWWGGFTASAGDVFDLFDWNGTLTGNFGNVLLPTLDPGLVWDIADLYTTGEIRVNAVPVPAAVWLFGSGLIGLVAAARRRRPLASNGSVN